MKRNYIIPITELVKFGTNGATMGDHLTNMTDASNAGGPGAPQRGEGATVKLTKMYI